MDSKQMDSKQIEEFLSTICRFTLMTLAFGKISGFHEDFLTFCVTTLGDSVDILALQERLQEKFICILRSKLSALSSLSKLFKAGISCQYHVYYDTKCDNPEVCLSRDHKLWLQAFEDLKDEIIMKINKQYFDIAWVIDNSTEFTQKLNKHMDNFAKTRNLDFTDTIYINHLAQLKNDLQIMMNQYIEHQKDHHDVCCDDGYAYSSKPYFVCRCMPKPIQIEKEWINNLHIFIDEYNLCNAFYADRSCDFDGEEISYKVILQRDFSKKLKKQKKYRKDK